MREDSGRTIKNFADIHEVLSEFMSESRSPGEAYTLERMQKLMEFLGNPQDSYKVVHIAGTSGKTSTAYYMAALLRGAGIKVGLTVSPHVDEVNERVQVDLKLLSEGKFCSEFSIFLNQVKKSGITPTYFEVLVAFAYWEFDRQKVDYAVIEVGLGGLLDGTNVVSRRNKMCIVTDIGFDHVEVLGKTLPEITAQKAGIIKPYNTVFSYDQGDEIMFVIREVCEQQQAELHEIWSLKDSELPKNLPLFQRRNWYLAFSAFNHMVEASGIKMLSDAELAHTTEIYIPARMEEIRKGTKTVILDGAHNSQKLETLAKSIKKRFPGQKIIGLVSFAQTKQTRAEANIGVLKNLCDSLILTTFSREDEERFSMKTDKLVEACEDAGFTNWEIVEEPEKAFRVLLKRPEKVLLVTGSFFLLNHIRPLILKK